MDGVKLSMTLFIETESNRVLFADADKDSLDFLFELLSLPLAVVNGLLREHGHMNGSLENLYKDMQNLNNEYMLPGQSRKTLLEPIRPHSATLFHTPQTTGTPPDQKFYCCIHCRGGNISNDPSDICPDCNLQTTLVEANGAPSPLQQALNRGGSANGIVAYVITDDLVVEPISMSSTSGILALLKKLNVHDLNTVQERVVNLTNHEAVMLLKARLSTDKVLTEVFVKGQHQGNTT